MSFRFTLHKILDDAPWLIGVSKTPTRDGKYPRFRYSLGTMKKVFCTEVESKPIRPTEEDLRGDMDSWWRTATERTIQLERAKAEDQLVAMVEKDGMSRHEMLAWIAQVMAMTAEDVEEVVWRLDFDAALKEK